MKESAMPAQSSKRSGKVSIRVQQVENGFTVDVDDYDSFEMRSKSFVAKDKEAALKVVDDALAGKIKLVKRPD